MALAAPTASQPCSHNLDSQEASTSGRQPERVRCARVAAGRAPACQRRTATRLRASTLGSVGTGREQPQGQQLGAPPGGLAKGGNGRPPPTDERYSRLTTADEPVVVAPEDYVMPQGQLSLINLGTPPSAADAFFCADCTLPQCQVGGGACLCTVTWRPFQHSAEGRGHCHLCIFAAGYCGWGGRPS